jgi:hypothetical protein
MRNWCRAALGAWITLDHSVSNGQVSHKELKPEDLIGKKIGVQSGGQR